MHVIAHSYSFMDKKAISRITITGALILFFVGVCIFFFNKLQVEKKGSEVDLYTLVPLSCTAIAETNNLSGLIDELDEFHTQTHMPAIEFSPLFSMLKHLNKDIDKMLISFHGSGMNDKNQVIYCRLSSLTDAPIESLIRNIMSPFPPKQYVYKGETITIYPLKDSDFLACYSSATVIVMSYHKKLIENVIDAQLSGKSILKDKTFLRSKDSKKTNNLASLYIKYPFPDEWTEFDVKFNDKTICLSGVCVDNEKQKPTDIPSGKEFPKETFYLCQKMNKQDSVFPNQYTTECLFYSGNRPKEVQSVSYTVLMNEQDAERAKATMKHFKFYKATDRWYSIYTTNTNRYACFYNNALLISPKDSCIYNYISDIEKEATLELNCPYQQILSGYVEQSDFCLYANLKDAFAQPRTNIKQVPYLFFLHKEVFEHFILSMQFSCSDGKMYPSIVLHSITKPS